VARDDWRIRIELEEKHAHGFLERLGLDMSSRAKELAQELKDERLPVTRDDDTLFVYASSGPEAERARQVVQVELEEAGVTAHVLKTEHWLDHEDRWDDEPDEPDVEEELVSRGFAPWEVRVDLASHEQADALADVLEGEGYDVIRRWTFLIVGAQSREDADALAKRVHGDVEAGGELVWEVMPQNPFAVFGGLGG
jgi:hypothetical protein